MDFLSTIMRKKNDEVAALSARVPLRELQARVRDAGPVRGFARALSEGGGARIIAEMKRASPSLGMIREDFHPGRLARAFQEGGAAAVSVLTDEAFFRGSLDDLRAARRSCVLPILRKDFIFTEYQVYQSRVAGADAFLLIAAAVPPGALADLAGLGGALGMSVLVEVHSREELPAALKAGTGIVGINNRNLKTFTTSVDVTRRLLADIPGNIVVVSESGIDAPPVIRELQREGVDAFLIGEAIMRASDVRACVEELTRIRD